MSYTLEGSAEGFARLNEFRAKQSANALPPEDPFSFYRAYEEFLFPNDPDLRDDPSRLAEVNRTEDSLLGHLMTLDDSEISALSKLSILDRVKIALPVSRFSNFGSTIFNQSLDQLRYVVELVLSQVENDVEERIGGPFSVVRVNRLVTRAGASDKSAKWHFDPTPCGFFKIFAYLSGPEAHDGATDFLDGQASTDLLKAGYHLLTPDKRASNLEDLPCSVKQVSEIKNRGDVYLFNPALTTHRGNYPKIGRRDVFEISILRSPVAWRESFEELYGLTAMSGNPSYTTWPRWVS
ncbi:MAG: hypothetical protein ACE37E_10430 [Hyphomicrobiales bacterium]